MSESWREVFRRGIAPQLSTAGLQALATALREDDDRLLQGQTTEPPGIACVSSWDVEGACLIGYAGWKGDGLKAVDEVGAFFADVCAECDVRMGEPASARWLLNHFDDGVRAKVIRELLPEVLRVLAEREAVHAGA